MDKSDFEKEFERRFGIGSTHARVRGQKWLVQKYRSDDIKSLGIKWGDSNRHSASDTLEKLRQEQLDNPNTTLKPLPIIANYDSLRHDANWKAENPHCTELTILKDNVLLLTGMEESQKRDTNEASPANGVTHVQLGSDGTAELESQTGLLSAVGNRKEYAVDGSRTVPTGTQTAKYYMVFDADTDGFSLPQVIREAAQFNQASGGIAHSRLKSPDFTLESGEAVLTQINVIDANG
jgi:hypothetical protein